MEITLDVSQARPPEHCSIPVDRCLLLSAMHKLYDDDTTPALLNNASCDASPEVADAMLFFVREIRRMRGILTRGREPRLRNVVDH
jgi:hypothetical protein